MKFYALRPLKSIVKSAKVDIAAAAALLSVAQCKSEQSELAALGRGIYRYIALRQQCLNLKRIYHQHRNAASAALEKGLHHTQSCELALLALALGYREECRCRG